MTDEKQQEPEYIITESELCTHGPEESRVMVDLQNSINPSALRDQLIRK